MNIKIFKKRRSVKTDYNENFGTQNENNSTELYLEFADDMSAYTVQRIVFITPDGNLQDLIENNYYKIKNSITKYKEVKAYIWLTNSQGLDFRTEEFELNFLENENADHYVPEEEKIDIMTTLIEELNLQIKKVEDLIEEVKELKEGIELETERLDKVEQDVARIENKTDGLSNDITNLNLEINSLKLNVESHEVDINNLDNEVDRLTENINAVASDVEKNKADILELEENQNYLEENKADKSEIPDVSEFIKNTVDNLINYYKKSETYTQAEVNELIGQIKTVSMKVLPEKPAVGETNIIYLIPSTKVQPENIYDEWIYVDNKWEKIRKY